MHSEQNKVIYNITHFIFRLYIRLLKNIKIIGTENIPSEGGVILAPNHVSYFDPPVIATSIMKRPIRFMAKESLLKMLFYGWYMKKLGAFPVKRKTSDVSSYRKALKLLKSGEVVLIFPEGTRGDGKVLGKAKPGVGRIAAASGAPVVPVTVTYSQKMKLFTRDNILVAFGQPVYFNAGPDRKKEEYFNFGEELLRKIEQMDISGVYNRK
jgi:1-acyl-sn-glycerol-3-phosphate acyltransferase